ncbi:Demethylmenaquinone methyltransferase [Salinarchaeum sp. Harcht-Bsk1]|uniref:RraA family protein n=1 Tax=Salinarchaeum sp. Harcht-Bsk1 TaxID=1333523 RepID=UPI0003424510|nr:RraA family protein [Salinarchaeum sp. Harcht-Bsk1]AGN01411.1 Demethylmenaquinone methyltransferase [Salinarchaeum sp. Harcht-Bsk1]
MDPDYSFDLDGEPRELDVSDLERIERFREAGYGGSVADALYDVGLRRTVFDQEFFGINRGQTLVGRALPVKLHTYPKTDDVEDYLEAKWEHEHDGVHPQKRLMRRVEADEDGSVLVFDTGGDMQPAHFGEMSCTLAKAHGARGMLCAGNVRDTRYVQQLEEFPVYTLGTTPNWHGGWEIVEVAQPIHVPGHLSHYVTVRPGDWVFGDLDGVQLIPREVVDEVLLRVEDIYEEETEERRKIEEGMPIDEVYEEYGVL